MLKNISIKNFAIIEDITISFSKGMTALTGQTGAGKSLIIDSLGLLLGDRADSDMIRYGAKKAIVQGTFETNNKYCMEILEKLGINDYQNILITREINENSKNNIKINNVSINLSQLKAIGNYLADIHVQHDTFRLINQDSYVSLLDKFGDNSLDKAFNDYQIGLSKYKDKYKKYHDALKKSRDLNDKLDLLKFQYNEILGYNLDINEYDELKEKINKLSNYDKIYNNLNLAYESLSKIDNIYDAYNSLNKIKDYDEKYNDYQEKISGFYYEMEDIKDEIKRQIDTLDFDPEVLDLLIERQSSLLNLQKKYKMNINEIIEYFNKIEEEIKLNENYDEYIKDRENELIFAYNNVLKLGNNLSNIRKKIALKLEKNLIDECSCLDLENLSFKVDFKNIVDGCTHINAVFNENGIDDIDFLVSFNRGEPLKPLGKIASGGELSRLMLGFKSIFASIQNLSLIVFDEIDSGISGYAASKMAEKIYNISKNTQVLCITHLPHVASIADNHINIYKIWEDERTKTGIEKLDYDKRVNEIALMISGNKISSYAIDAAKELLKK